MPSCPPLSCPARIRPFRAHCPSSNACFLTIRLPNLVLLGVNRTSMVQSKNGVDLRLFAVTSKPTEPSFVGLRLNRFYNFLCSPQNLGTMPTFNVGED